MIKEALEYLQGLARPTTIDVEGRTYRVSKDRLSTIQEPEADSIVMHTLGGVADFINEEKPGVLNRGVMLHVVGYDTVKVVSNIFGKWHQRDLFAVSTPLDRDAFPFERFMDLDTFAIHLSSKFVETADRSEILKMLSSVKAESIKTSQDDGISQSVTVKNRLGQLEEVKVNPIVELAPFRTFTEVNQPVSKFLVRMRQDGDNLPTIALFEADGGAWKVDAMIAIREYFNLELPDVPIIS